MSKNTKRHHKKSFIEKNHDEKTIEYKLVAPEIEELLKKKPVKIKGIGLSDNFHALFSK